MNNDELIFAFVSSFGLIGKLYIIGTESPSWPNDVIPSNQPNKMGPIKKNRLKSPKGISSVCGVTKSVMTIIAVENRGATTIRIISFRLINPRRSFRIIAISADA